MPLKQCDVNFSVCRNVTAARQQNTHKLLKDWEMLKLLTANTHTHKHTYTLTERKQLVCGVFVFLFFFCFSIWLWRCNKSYIKTCLPHRTAVCWNHRWCTLSSLSWIYCLYLYHATKKTVANAGTTDPCSHLTSLQLHHSVIPSKNLYVQKSMTVFSTSILHFLELRFVDSFKHPQLIKGWVFDSAV